MLPGGGRPIAAFAVLTGQVSQPGRLPRLHDRPDVGVAIRPALEEVADHPVRLALRFGLPRLAPWLELVRLGTSLLAKSSTFNHSPTPPPTPPTPQKPTSVCQASQAPASAGPAPPWFGAARRPAASTRAPACCPRPRRRRSAPWRRPLCAPGGAGGWGPRSETVGGEGGGWVGLGWVSLG